MTKPVEEDIRQPVGWIGNRSVMPADHLLKHAKRAVLCGRKGFL